MTEIAHTDPQVAAPPRAVERAATGFLRETGELTAFAARALVALVGAPRYMSEVLRHAAMMVRGTSFLMLAMNAFLGISVVNFGFFFLRSIGASDYTGLATGYVDIRQAAPAMFGYVFTAKICCGFAAEIGAMKINEEIDAYDATGVDVMRYVVATRLLAVLIFLPIGAIISLIGVTLGSFLAAVVVLHGLSPQGFLTVHWSVQTLADQYFAMIAMAVIALTTATTACFLGLRASGGPAGVGSAVARSLMINLVLVHLIAASFAVFFYGTDIRLPIGG